jgi:hypothetical protein
LFFLRLQTHFHLFLLIQLSVAIDAGNPQIHEWPPLHY